MFPYLPELRKGLKICYKMFIIIAAMNLQSVYRFSIKIIIIIRENTARASVLTSLDGHFLN